MLLPDRESPVRRPGTEVKGGVKTTNKKSRRSTSLDDLGAQRS